MILLLAKIISAIAAVLALATIAERISPRAAGIMAGFPLGSGIALFFIGFEQGPAFGSEAALYCLPGLASALICISSYYLGLNLGLKLYPKRSILMASSTACLGFYLSAVLFNSFSYTLLTATVVPVASIILLHLLFKRIENQPPVSHITTTAKVIVIRAIAAATMVVTVTGLAQIIGAEWSGLLAAFPVTMLPFLILLHHQYGAEQAITVIKNFPAGLGALVVFSISVYLSFIPLGVIAGTGFSYAMACLYLLGIGLITRRGPMRG